MTFPGYQRLVTPDDKPSLEALRLLEAIERRITELEAAIEAHDARIAALEP
jgi:hypothetical protein